MAVTLLFWTLQLVHRGYKGWRQKKRQEKKKKKHLRGLFKGFSEKYAAGMWIPCFHLNNNRCPCKQTQLVKLLASFFSVLTWNTIITIRFPIENTIHYELFNLLITYFLASHMSCCQDNCKRVVVSIHRFKLICYLFMKKQGAQCNAFHITHAVELWVNIYKELFQLKTSPTSLLTFIYFQNSKKGSAFLSSVASKQSQSVGIYFLFFLKHSMYFWLTYI